jgi:hypothetical protein
MFLMLLNSVDCGESTPNIIPDFQSSASSFWDKVSTKGDIPPQINGHSAIVYKDKMYVFGGCTTKGVCSRSLFSYNYQ